MSLIHHALLIPQTVKHSTTKRKQSFGVIEGLTFVNGLLGWYGLAAALGQHCPKFVLYPMLSLEIIHEILLCLYCISSCSKNVPTSFQQSLSNWKYNTNKGGSHEKNRILPSDNSPIAGREIMDKKMSRICSYPYCVMVMYSNICLV